jgi:multidrug efflux system membrane fusion protein
MTVVFSVAEDHLPSIQEQLRRGHRLSVEAFDRTQQKKLASGSLQSLDNQIDYDHWNAQAEGDLPKQRQRPLS